MEKTVMLHTDMGGQLLDHLRQFGDFPSQGILAGQAVDSAISDLYGSGGGVYNDIDIFRNVPNSRRKNYQKFATFTAGRTTLEFEEPRGYMGMREALRLIQCYQIKSVSRHDMLNFVNCTMADRARTIRLTVVVNVVY